MDTRGPYAQQRPSPCSRLKPSPGHSDSPVCCFSSFHLARAPLTFSASSLIPKGRYHTEDTAPNGGHGTSTGDRDFSCSPREPPVSPKRGEEANPAVSNIFFTTCCPEARRLFCKGRKGKKKTSQKTDSESRFNLTVSKNGTYADSSHNTWPGSAHKTHEKPFMRSGGDQWVKLGQGSKSNLNTD